MTAAKLRAALDGIDAKLAAILEMLSGPNLPGSPPTAERFGSASRRARSPSVGRR